MTMHVAMTLHRGMQINNFVFLHENIGHGYSLEQHMFSWRNKNKS